MKSLLLAAALCSSAMSLEWNHEFSTAQLMQENMHGLFQSWRFAHKKAYKDIEEEVHRFGIFKANLERIAQSNDEHLAGQISFRLRMNKFGDMTEQEFHDMYSCLVRPLQDEQKPAQKQKVAPKPVGERLQAATVDWTAAGKVTPVKDQGQCGSCWSFSATGAMECEFAIKNNVLNSLSEQQLVDCSSAYGNDGCNGGWYYDAWKYAEAVGGLCLESAYPYKAVQGSCQQNTCGQKYNKPSGYTEDTADSESALETAANKGCVSVAIEADQFAFQYYSGGVLTGTCGTRIDHAVLVTGYGTLNGQDYWLVKNSWGTSWGVDGYVYICKDCNANGAKGECGIDMYPYQPNY